MRKFSVLSRSFIISLRFSLDIIEISSNVDELPRHPRAKARNNSIAYKPGTEKAIKIFLRWVNAKETF